VAFSGVARRLLSFSHDDVASLRVEYPDLHFTYSSGRKGTIIVLGYEFDLRPQTLTVRDQFGS
jgi:hypothetical protein